ncbi:DUF6366 family protein [Ureibacillus sp. 179-F W5.1 NHS]|uniref:Phage capsid protein n=1 Tax=Lysinibacillus halotolerans TaxID=1368476 RepID=A0A3M8H531_9BACI|nr:DUF6366 family protein [Lysinibacillus halotolerans]RNC97493.1 hypothetical protein EC501_15095 [Lysinibacillus halotolerans]
MGKETPEQTRERLRKEERKRNPTGNMNNAFKKAGAGSFADLNWKGTGILILVVLFVFIIASIMK